MSAIQFKGICDIIMAHTEHNKSKRSSGFLLIIVGAILFMMAPTRLSDSPEMGWVVIIFGFIIGGFGFYVQFFRKKKG